MLRRMIGAFVMALLLAATTAEARPKILLQPFAGLRFGSSFGQGYYENTLLEGLDVAPAAEFGASLGVPVWTSGLPGQLGAIEFTYSYQKSDLRFEPASMDAIPPETRERFEVDGDKLVLGKIGVSYLHLGGLYQFGDFSGWLPFVNFGVGATLFSAPDGQVDTESKFSGSFGGGISRMFNETVGARLQLKGHITSLPANEAYWIDPWGGVWAITDDNSFFQGNVSLGVVLAL